MIRFILVNFLALLLTSCTSVTTPPASINSTATPSWNMRTAQLNRIQHWQIRGKVAVQTPQDASSASVNWQQQPGKFTITLLGPIGTIGLKLNGQPGLATLDTTDGKHFSATSAEKLLAQQWGFNLPIAYLRYWVRGLPAAKVPATTHFDASNRLASLQQAGWHIQFQSYTRVQGIDLPERIIAESPGMKVKLAVHQWGI